MDIPFENFKGYCENFGCILHKPKKGEVDWIITSDDPTNFFWLGCNMNLKSNCNLCISTAEKFGIV